MDILQDYRKADKAFRVVESELQKVEERYQAALDERQRAFLEVARLDRCNEKDCLAAPGYPCLYPTGTLGKARSPCSTLVHSSRERGAKARLKALGALK